LYHTVITLLSTIKICYIGATAGVVEWYTRATQNRMAQALRVQVPPPAQNKRAQSENLELLATIILSLEEGLEDLLRYFWKNEQKYPKGVLKL
jgi:hypothetical protein